MLHDIQQLYGHSLAASDGEIGRVKDFYFDDKTWVIRYLVADTGAWLSGRLVLLSPHAFGHWDRDGKQLAVNLTRQQIEDSPSIESHKPVSRQFEIDYYQYYGWPAYWNGGAIWGLGGFPVVMPPSKDQMEAQRHPRHLEDKHLQSTKAVTGYAIHATDGELGTVSGFQVDDRSWAVDELIIQTGHWFLGKKIRIPTSQIGRISYEKSEVFVKLSKDAIRHAADLDEAKASPRT